MWDLFTMARGVGIMVLYLAAFLFAGCLLPEKFCRNSLSERMMAGFAVYFSLFHLIALPLKALKLPLSCLSTAWCAVLILILAAVLLLRRGVLRQTVLPRKMKASDWAAVLLTVILAVILAAVLGMNINHISDFDAAYYIGLSPSSVYSNTIEMMDPYSGKLLQRPVNYYLLNTLTAHSAVMYRVFGIHPVLEQKFSMTMALSVMFILTMFRGGMFLFQEDRKKSAAFTWLSLLSLWFSFSISGTSHYFAYRTYEGKSVTAFLLMPMIVICYFSLFQENTMLWGLSGMFFTGLCGAAFCNTAIYLVPLLTGILLLAFVLHSRKLKMIPQTALVLLPGMVWILAEVLR